MSLRYFYRAVKRFYAEQGREFWIGVRDQLRYQEPISYRQFQVRPYVRLFSCFNHTDLSVTQFVAQHCRSIA